MLYPNNIILKHKRKRDVAKEKLKQYIKTMKRHAKYLVFDRKNINKIIAVKLHI